jgi:hypothetical protein
MSWKLLGQSYFQNFSAIFVRKEENKNSVTRAYRQARLVAGVILRPAAKTGLRARR